MTRLKKVIYKAIFLYCKHCGEWEWNCHCENND